MGMFLQLKDLRQTETEPIIYNPTSALLLPFLRLLDPSLFFGKISHVF
jgi:hypothetical protein